MFDMEKLIQMFLLTTYLRSAGSLLTTVRMALDILFPKGAAAHFKALLGKGAARMPSTSTISRARAMIDFSYSLMLRTRYWDRGQALQNSWDRPALGTGHSKFLGQARSWDRPFKILGTNLLSGQALQNSWDKPALGTGPSKFLEQSRYCDMPFNVFGGCHFLQTVLANTSPPTPKKSVPDGPSGIQVKFSSGLILCLRCVKKTGAPKGRCSANFWQVVASQSPC